MWFKGREYCIKLLRQRNPRARLHEEDEIQAKMVLNFPYQKWVPLDLHTQSWLRQLQADAKQMFGDKEGEVLALLSFNLM